MKLIPNRVIIKLTRKEDELDLGSGNKIFIDPSFAREMHTPTVGIIVNHPKELDPTKMMWVTPMEIKTGDYAVFSYESSIHALADDDSRVLMDENKDLYIIIDYEDIFLVKRKSEIIPINGYVLCKPFISEVKSTIIIPQSAKKIKSDKFAVISHIGSRCEKYMNADGTDRLDLYDPEFIGNVGDKVLIAKNSDLPVEFELHQTVAGRKETFFRVRRCYIKSIIKN